MHWILSPPDSYLKALPRTAIIYGDRAFKEVIKLKQSFKDGALIQQDVFLRSTNTRDLHTQRTGQVTMLREDRSLWATQRGLGGNLPYWRLDLGLSALRIVRKNTSVFFCYGYLSNWCSDDNEVGTKSLKKIIAI